MSQTGRSFDVCVVKITSVCHSLQVIETGSTWELKRLYSAVFKGYRKHEFPAGQIVMSVMLGGKKRPGSSETILQHVGLT